MKNEIKQQLISGGSRNGDWKRCLFSDKFKRITRKNKDGNRNVLTISAQQGLINQFEYYNHQYASEDTSSYTLLKRGDFAYNKSYSDGYPWGALKRLERYDSGIVSPLYICFAPKNGVCSDFYKQYFEAGLFNREIYKIAQEGARNHGLLNVSTEDFFNAMLADPPIEEQRKIAEILGCCDEVIRLKKELIAEKKKQKKALMQKLLDPNSGFRLPGFSGEWKNLKLHECGSFRKGSGISSTDCRNTGKPCVKYGDIYMSFNTAFSQAVSCIAEEMFNCCLQVCRGTLLFTCSGEDPLEIGKCVVYLGKDPIAVGGDLIAMFPYDEANSLFLAYQQDSATLIKQKAVLSKGNSIVHIHLSEIQELKIQLPPTQEEQQAIADILLAADQEIDLLEQELTEQEKKKKSLMQLLLIGIVRVK